MELQGLEHGQWVSIGVCTAATMNTSRHSQDAVIFQATVTDKRTRVVETGVRGSKRKETVAV